MTSPPGAGSTSTRVSAADPDLADVRRAMHAELLDGLDVDELRERILRSQRDRLLVMQGTPAGQDWRLRVERNATRRYPAVSV